MNFQGPFKSTRKYKKFYVIVDVGKKIKRVHFGDTRYDDFTVHKDKKRREKYLARALRIKDKKGRLTKDNPFSPNYWALRLLWNYKD